MTIEKALRIMAGIMILLSTALTYFVSPWWFLLTAFIGLNLLQSGFSNKCPAMVIMNKLGLKPCVPQDK